MTARTYGRAGKGTDLEEVAHHQDAWTAQERGPGCGGPLERWVDAVARKPSQTEFVLPAYLGLMVSYLIKDGLLRRHEIMPDYKARTEGVFALDLSVARWYEITEKGIDFIERWKSARPLD